jgi:hypothetical protein
MRLVYKHATCVIVWLGRKTPGVEQAFGLAKKLAGVQRTLGRLDSVMARQELDLETVREFMGSLLADAPASSMQYLSELLARRYFTRLWRMQEVVAASSVIMRCEEPEMSFFDLIGTSQFVIGWLRKMPIENLLELWFMVYYTIRQSRQIGTPSVEGSMVNLLELQEHSRAFKATDPRDKVYALLDICDEGLKPVLGLTRVMGGEGGMRLRLLRGAVTRLNNFVNCRVPGADWGIPPALKPEYRKDVISVYTDLTRFMVLKQPRVLDILDHVQQLEDPSAGGYPSWMPKWFEPKSCRVLSGCFLAGLCDGHFPYFAELHDCPYGVPSARSDRSCGS